MDSFDITRLTDVDFEALCKDLLDETLGARFEIFAVGPDGGIDLRFRTPNGEAWIAQCKHWWRSSAASLLSKVRAKERSKVDRLKPDRYFLLTSASLTPKVKDQLAAALAPYVRNSNDIWGLRELEEELRRNPRIVWRHIRLWLSGTSVLQAAIRSNILQRSRFLIEEIGETLNTYVANESLSRAVDLLDSQHVCVISGVPGVGKTTLAQVLSAAHMQTGFQLVEISEDIEEAFALWSEDHPQLFYYDDFLGQTSSDDKLRKNEDSRLIKVMRAVATSPNKRLILTTRGYILAQAQNRYEKLGAVDITPYSCVVELSDLDELVRGQLLYNHIYRSSLSAAEKAQFSRPQEFWPIVSHPNFNPRLIAISLSLSSSYGPGPSDVPRFVLQRLEDPSRLWDPLVLYQLDRAQVRILEVIYTLPSTNAPTLINAWVAFREDLGESSEADIFRAAASVLEGSMITIQWVGGESRIAYHNPSIRDYFGLYLAQRPATLAALLRSASSFDQIDQLWRLIKAKGQNLEDEAGHANVWDKRSLDDIGQLFVETAVTLLHSQHNGDTEPYRSRVLTALEIAEDSQSVELTAEVAEFLDLYANDIATENVSPEEMAALIERLDGAKSRDIRVHAEIIASDYLQMITEDLTEWARVAEAQRAIDLLPRHHVDDHFIEEVDLATRTEVQGVVTRWTSGDPSVRSELSLDQVLRLAERHLAEIRAGVLDLDGDENYPDPITALRNLASLQGDHPMAATHIEVRDKGDDSSPPPALVRIFSTLTTSEDS